MSCHTGITGADGLQVWRRSVLASADPSVHALPDRMPASTYHEPVHDLLRWVDVGASHRRLTHTHIHTPWFHRTIRDKNTFKTINNDSNFYIQEIPENWLVFPLHLEFLENGLKSYCWFMAIIRLLKFLQPFVKWFSVGRLSPPAGQLFLETQWFRVTKLRLFLLEILRTTI